MSQSTLQEQSIASAIDDIFGDSSEQESSLESSEEIQTESNDPEAEAEEELAVPQDEEDEQSTEEESEEDSEESTEEEAKEEDSALPDTITVKADGKNVTIDFTDRDHITRVYQKYVAQTRYQKERDEARAQLADMTKSVSEEKDMIALLNENIDNPEEMYRLFTGGQNLKDKFKEWQEQEDSFALMSEDEKKSYLDAKNIEAREKELAKKEAALQRSIQDSELKKDEATLADQQAVFSSVFEQVRFNEITDVDEALALDDRLFNDIKVRLSKYDEYNKEIIVKEAKEAADALRKLLNVNNRRQETKSVKKKKVQAKKAAAKAAETPVSEEPKSFLDGLSEAMGFDT